MMGGWGGAGAGGDGNDGSSIMSGAAQGGSMGGPWGAVIGAAMGLLQGREKNRQKKQKDLADAKILALSPYLKDSAMEAGMREVKAGPTGADNLIGSYGAYLAQSQKDQAAKANAAQGNSIWDQMGKPKRADELRATETTARAMSSLGPYGAQA